VLRRSETPGIVDGARLLYATLQVRYPDLRSLLITGVQAKGAVSLAHALAETIAASGRVTVLGIAGEGDSIEAYAMHSEGHIRQIDMADRARLLHVPFVRELIREYTAYNASCSCMVVLATEDLLRAAESTVLAACVDGVVLVAQAGRTRERELRRARMQLDAVAARLVGSVYVKGKLQ
jgi:hypothetical protein